MNAHARKTFIASLALIFGTVAIGIVPILVRISEVGPTVTGFWRQFLALPFLAIFAWIEHKRDRKPVQLNGRDYYWIFMSGIAFGVGIAIWNTSVNMTTVANATILGNCIPEFVALWTWLVLKHRPKPLLIVGLSLSIMGVILLARPEANTTWEMFKGDALALLSAVAFAAYMLMIQHARQKVGTFLLMALSTFSGMIALLIIGIFSSEHFAVPSLMGWLVLLGFALSAQVIGQTFIAYAVPFLPITFSSAMLIIQPVIATSLGWMLFAEHLTTWQLTGAILAILGIAFTKEEAQKAHRRRKEA